MGIVAVCTTGCGSATLMHDGGAAGDGTSGQGGTAGHPSTGTGGNAGAGGKVGTGGVAGGTAGTSGGGAGGGDTGGAGTGGTAGSAGGSCGSQVGVSCGSTCNPGTYTCSLERSTCSHTIAPPGTTCGTGQVCDGSGNCATCSAGGSCGTTCKPGTYDCSSGTQVCKQTPAAPGTTCGSGMVCDGNGGCADLLERRLLRLGLQPRYLRLQQRHRGLHRSGQESRRARPAGRTCSATAAATATRARRTASCGTTCAPGTYSCTTGVPVCNQSPASLGTSCGSNLICNGSGGCVAKTADGGTCSSNVACQNGNCSTYSVSGASICCPVGNSNCGSCVAEQTDNGNCGACGNKCGPNRSCQSGSCSCQGYALPSSCGGCGSWSFESGTTEGWTKDTDPAGPVSGGTGNGATNVVQTTSQVHDGSYALAVPMLDLARNHRGVGRRSALRERLGDLCERAHPVGVGQGPLERGKHARPTTWLLFSAWGPSGSDHEPIVFGNITADAWFQVSYTFATAFPVDHIAIYLTTTNWQARSTSTA